MADDPGELGRAETVLANWARYPRVSKIDGEVHSEVARVEQAIIGGRVRVRGEYGGLQLAMKRSMPVIVQIRGVGPRSRGIRIRRSCL